MLKFFPDDAPADPSDNLKAMTVRDLLTMTGGHDTEPKTVGGGPSVQDVPGPPVVHKPGTHFQYNTIGSYTLSAIVTKATGQTELEYLEAAAVRAAGDREPEVGQQPRRQLARRLRPQAPHRRHRQVRPALPAKGQVERQATGPGKVGRAGDEQAGAQRQGIAREDRRSTGQQGYGFQFWRCTHNAFRGDGASGQFCVVIPDKDAVVAITAETGNMQGELNAIWDNLYPAFQAEALPEDAAGQEKLKQVIAKLEAHPAKKGK